MSSPNLLEPMAAHAAEMPGPDGVARCFIAAGVVTDKRQATKARKAETGLVQGLMQRPEIAA